MVEIEKNVPIPERAKNRRNKYQFEKMEIGDSFTAPGIAASCNKCNAYNAANQYGRNNGKRFSGKLVVPGKVRIWRVE